MTIAQNASKHRSPLITGLFVALAVISVGAVVGVVTGFTTADTAEAQAVIVVTAPAPVVPIVPPPVITPPIVVPVPVIVIPGPVTTGTGNGSGGGSHDGDIVVTGPSTDNPNGPSCCTAVSTPSVPDVIVTAPGTDNPNGPSCCTTLPPEIPPIFPPFIPPTTPPVIPPPHIPSSSCISLTSNKTIITPGEAVTLTWAVDNDKPVTITDVTHGGTVTTSNNLTGTTVVNPTGETTYHASVPSDQNNPDCTVTVKVATITNSSSCTLLSADKTNINSGEAVVLTWKVNNDSPVTITDTTHNTTVTTSTNQNGTFTVNPTEATTYHASVPSDQNNANCTVSVNLQTSSCTEANNCTTGGGSSHGHSSHKKVYFTSENREAPPLSSVYLSQIPYTGLDLGPVGTILYWAMLVIWSLAAAYLILFGGLPLLRRKFAAFGANVNEALNSQPAPPPAYAGAGMAYAMPAGNVPASAPSIHQAVHAAAVAAAVPQVMERIAQTPAARPAPRLEMSGAGFKKFASGGALTIDDIVKGLSRESGMELATESVHEAPVMEQAAPAPQSYEAPRAVAPAQMAAEVHPDVVGFIGAILAGERDMVFSTVRHLTQAGHDVEEFVSHAVLALDDAYHARIDGTPVHEDVKRVTDHCATPFLERLVTALTTAVDGSYSMGVTGIKLALTRALSVAQG